ncbi:MAG: ribonuclease HII [Thermoplasmata archaeon]
MPTVLGLDEAGRGAWLGPLVVGAFLVRSEQIDRLRSIGVRDSKRLAPVARERLYRALGEIGTYRAMAIPPATVDRRVAHGELNRLEAESFAALIRSLRADEIRLDACDVDPARFGRSVGALAGTTIPIRSAHRMDATDPVVGAASIVAKVERDRAVARAAASLGLPIGSGYPSDPRTRRFVEEAHRRAPSRLHGLWRRSWAPSQRLIAARTARALEEFGP